MKPAIEPSFTALVGIDWSDRKHDFCLQAAGSSQREFGVLVHSPEAITLWAKALYRRFGGPIAVCLEIAKGPLVHALPQSADMRTLATLVEQRRLLVGDKTRITNRLSGPLKEYFPQALDWFEDRDTVLFCDFLQRWPALNTPSERGKRRCVHSSRTQSTPRIAH